MRGTGATVTVKDALVSCEGLDRQVAVQTRWRDVLAEAKPQAGNRSCQGYWPLFEQLGTLHRL
jgi:hypothetical protein